MKRRSTDRDSFAEATLSLLDEVPEAVEPQPASAPEPATAVAEPPPQGRSARRAAKTVAMPELVGLASEDAIEQLRGLDLCPAPEAAVTEDPAQVGVVLQQLPPCGVELARGDVVDLFVGCLESEASASAVDDDWYGVAESPEIGPVEQEPVAEQDQASPPAAESDGEPTADRSGGSAAAGSVARRVSRKRRGGGQPGVVRAAASSPKPRDAASRGVATTRHALGKRAMSAVRWRRLAVGARRPGLVLLVLPCVAVLLAVVAFVSLAGSSSPHATATAPTVPSVRTSRVYGPSVPMPGRQRAFGARPHPRSRRVVPRRAAARAAGPQGPSPSPPPATSPSPQGFAPSIDDCEACAEHIN